MAFRVTVFPLMCMASILQLPLYASILVHLFKCADHLLPTTQYEIFCLLVCNCIFRHLKKTSDHKISGIRSLDNLPPDIAEPFQNICEIAYNGVMKDTVSFDIDADLNTLGLLQGVESFALCGMSRSYNFLHLSVQELLAARHIANQLEASQQVDQFRELLGQARFSAVFQFYAAITKLRTPGITDVVMQVVRKCSKECHKIDDRNRLLPLINCLYEAQDSQLCHTVLDQFGSKLNLENVSLSPSDCLSVGYFLTYAKRNYKVNLVNCSIAPEGCRTLFRKGNNFHFVYLYFNYNPIGDEGALIISSALKSMTTLLELCLTHNSIGDQGAIALSGVLESLLNLEVLDLSNNSVGDEGALAISRAINTMVNLRELNLGFNCIGQSGKSALVADVQDIKIFLGSQKNFT